MRTEGEEETEGEGRDKKAKDRSKDSSRTDQLSPQGGGEYQQAVQHFQGFEGSNFQGKKQRSEKGVQGKLVISIRYKRGTRAKVNLRYCS